MARISEKAAQTAPDGGPRRSAKPRARKKAASRLEDARSRMYQELIFESAECVFGEKGFEHATMQEIAAEAGVSLKTVYASFPGKQDLYDAIMLARGRAMFEALQAAHAETEGDPVEMLVAGTRAFAGYLFEHRDWSRIHVRSQTSWAMRPDAEPTATLWDEGQAAHIEMLKAGIEAGVFVEDDPAELALMIRAMTRIQVVHALERGDDDVEGVLERLVERLLRTVCRDGVPVRGAGAE